MSAIQPIAAIAPIMNIRPIRLPKRVPAIDVGAYSIMEYKRTKEATVEDAQIIVEGFAEEMKDRGHNYPVRRREEEVSPKQWHWPTSHHRYGIDTVDMAFICAHGGTFGMNVQVGSAIHIDPPFWFAASCNSVDGTDITSLVVDPSTWSPPDPKKPVANMRLGGGKLRWLIFESCRSVQIRAENEDKKEDKAKFAKVDPGRTWAPCHDGVHLLLGYTGYASHHFTLEKKGKAFARRAGRGDILSESWLDEAFSSRFSNCPAVIAFAPSTPDLEYRLKSQSLKKPGPASTRPARSFVYSSMWRSA